MILPRRLVFFALFVAVCARADAQTAPPSQSLPNAPLKSTEKSPDFSLEGFVVEQLHTKYTFENDGTGKKEVTARIKVQSEAGVEQWGQLVMGYNSANERVEIPYVRVLKTDGSVVSAPADAVQDLSAPVERDAPVYTDYRQKHVTVPGLRPGEVLEYDLVTVIHTALAPGQFWMEYDFDQRDIVLDEQLEVDVARNRKLKLKTKPGMDPKITEENARRIYRWTSSHLQREEEKEKTEKAKKNPFQEPEPPAVQMTTFAGWEEVGRWYSSLEKERREPTPEIKAKAAQLTAGKTPDLDKIEALYDFVATNFRYISLSFGVGRYQPHAAADVLHNQYGDCKDKHTLLASLLAAEGFQTSSVLINSRRKLDPDVPSPSQFDHVISLVPPGKEEIWMDTTTEVAPFRLLSINIRKKQALVIPMEGKPHLEETPANPPMPDIQSQELDGQVNEFGKLKGHVKFETRGDTELFVRILFRRVPKAKWEDLVKEMNAVGGLNGDVSNLKASDPTATREPFRLEYDIAVNNFFDWTKAKSQLALPMSQMSLADADPDLAPDADPIPLGAPGEYLYRIKLQFPSKYTGSVPLPFSMKRDYGEYSVNYKMEGSVFTAQRHLVTEMRELPASRVSDYLAFRRAILADTAQRLSVDTSAAGTPSATPDLKGDDLNDAANAALERGNFSLAVDLLKRVVADDPKQKAAWLNLGRAYMGLRQTDQAIDAFRKEAEANPYDEYAYNSLGWAYTTERKYDDAAAAYQKAIEINPLSDYAHGALGSMYSEAHQYDKAVPELEKAVSLKQDNAFLQINLGDAYLNLGQDDKALAAFDRAVEISATPEVWNDIAYQLSLKKVHLDRAQQYAESAVTAVSAALRNVTIDQLNPRDLGLVASLMANWDTLGWVYFGRGDLEKAEKYITAVWSLDQHGEVGDHLGQIYEKQGRKDDAIKSYAMAMSALRPMPETRTRLAGLVGGDKKVDAVADKYRDQLRVMRTIQLGKVAKETGSAEFFILLAASSQGTTVEGVKFISGDEKLKVFSEALRTATYNLKFPDDTPTKILRRGALGCSTTSGECSFVLLLPEDVHSVD